MSGLVIKKTHAACPPVSAILDKLCFVPWAKRYEISSGSFDIGISWIGDNSFLPFARTADTAVSIIMTGRLYDTDDDVLLCRKFNTLLEKYHKHGINNLTGFQGAGALAVFYSSTDTCFIITDRMGFFPLYVSSPDDGDNTLICSHPDVLASCRNYPPDIDDVTIAEFVSTGAISHPHTYYKTIRELEPGSIYVWDSEGFRIHSTYWKPAINPDYSKSIDDFSDDLSDAIRHSVAMRLQNTVRKTGLLLSGGLDSRTLLFSAVESSHTITGITFYTGYNREVAISQKLARAAGAEQVLLRRDYDYYGKIAVDAVRISGGTNTFIHAHSLGFIEDIHNLGLSLLLSGCYTDAFFKGLFTDHTVYKPLGIWLAREKLSPFSLDWYVPYIPLFNEKLRDEARRRTLEKFEAINVHDQSMETKTKIELARIYPVSRTPVFVFRSTMFRTLPFDFFIATNRLIDLYLTIPVSLKLNYALVKATLPKISAACAGIPDANTGVPITASVLRKVSYKLFERVQDRFKSRDSIVTKGSWIHFPTYFTHSQLIQELWEDVQQNSKDFINGIAGYNIFKEPLKTNDTGLLYRILTVGLWYRHRIT